MVETKPLDQSGLGVVRVVGLGLGVTAYGTRLRGKVAALDQHGGITAAVGFKPGEVGRRVEFTPLAHVFGVAAPAEGLAGSGLFSAGAGGWNYAGPAHK